MIIWYSHMAPWLIHMLSNNKKPSTCLGHKLGAVCVYVDGVSALVWEVAPVCTGRYEDLLLFFERFYVVCNTWYGYMIC